MGPGSGFPPASTPGCLFLLLCHLGDSFSRAAFSAPILPPPAAPHLQEVCLASFEVLVFRTWGGGGCCAGGPKL